MKHTQAVFRLAVRLPGSVADKKGKVTLGIWQYPHPSFVEYEIKELEAVSDEVECFITLWEGVPGNVEPELWEMSKLVVFNPDNRLHREKINELNKRR